MVTSLSLYLPTAVALYISKTCPYPRYYLGLHLSRRLTGSADDSYYPDLYCRSSLLLPPTPVVSNFLPPFYCPGGNESNVCINAYLLCDFRQKLEGHMVVGTVMQSSVIYGYRSINCECENKQWVAPAVHFGLVMVEGGVGCSGCKASGDRRTIQGIVIEHKRMWADREVVQKREKSLTIWERRSHVYSGRECSSSRKPGDWADRTRVSRKIRVRSRR